MSGSNGSSAWHQRSNTWVSSTPRQSRSRMPMGPANGHSRRLSPASASRARTACSSGRLASDADAAAAAELEADAGALALLEPEPPGAELVLARGVPRARARHPRAGGTCRSSRPGRRAHRAWRWRQAASTRPRAARSPTVRRCRGASGSGAGFRALTRRASVTSAPNSPAVSIHSMRRTRRVSSCSSLARGSAKCARHAVRKVLRLADVQERVVLADRRGRRRGLPAARPRAPGRVAAAGAKCRSAVARSRRVPPRATSRARCRGTRRARARHRARGGALRRRCRGGASRHRGCGRARRASARAKGAPCTAPARESVVRGVGTRCAGNRSRSARCARRRAGPRPARRCRRRRPRTAARPRPWPR